MGKMSYHNWNKIGFTLAELMVVVAIIAILAGVSVPLFSSALRNQRLKQVKDQETAAKAAAVAAFYAGYDSNNNPVDIKQNGYCTFLYDEANNAVYVLNYQATASDFSNYDIEAYGLKIDQSTDYSKKVILVTFEGRYSKSYDVELTTTISPTDKRHYLRNESKGTIDEPILDVKWVSGAIQ